MRKTIWIIVAVLALVASIGMYVVGKDSSHLSELMAFWFYPLPLVVIALIAAFSKPKGN